MHFYRDPGGTPRAEGDTREMLLVRLLEDDLADVSAGRALLAALDGLPDGQPQQRVRALHGQRLEMGQRFTLIEPLTTTDAEPGAVPTRALRDLVAEWVRFLEATAPPDGSAGASGTVSRPGRAPGR